MSHVMVAETALLSNGEFLMAHTRHVMSLVEPNVDLIYGDETLHVTHGCMHALLSLPYHLASISPSLFAACAVQSHRIIGSLMTALIGHYGFRISLSAPETKSLFLARAALHNIITLLPHRPTSSIGHNLPRTAFEDGACQHDLMSTYVAQRARDIGNVASKRVPFATLLRARRFKMSDAHALQNIANTVRDSSESTCRCTTHVSCGLQFHSLLHPVVTMTAGAWFIVKDLYFNVLRTAASHIIDRNRSAICVHCTQAMETCLHDLLQLGASFSASISTSLEAGVNKLQRLPWRAPLQCDALPSLSLLAVASRHPADQSATSNDALDTVATPSTDLVSVRQLTSTLMKCSENAATHVQQLAPRRSTRTRHVRSLLHPVLLQSALSSPKSKRAADRHKMNSAVK